MRYPTSQSGFSLVETLVAITILLLVIIGPLTISSSSVRSTSFASEQVVAFFLAQEGAEMMEKARDEYLLEHFRDTNPDPLVFTSANPDPWADFTDINGILLRNCYTARGCNTSMTATGILQPPSSCSGQDSCGLNLENAGQNIRSMYTSLNNGVKSVYSRRIMLQQSSTNSNEVLVTSIVTWRSGFSSDEQQVTVQNTLFNVYGTP